MQKRLSILNNYSMFNMLLRYTGSSNISKAIETTILEREGDTIQTVYSLIDFGVHPQMNLLGTSRNLLTAPIVQFY